MFLTSNWIFFKYFFHACRRFFRFFYFFNFFKNETKLFFWRRIRPNSISRSCNSNSVIDIQIQIFNFDFRFCRRQISRNFVAAKQFDAKFQIRKRRVFVRPRNRRATIFDICRYKRRSTNVWRRTSRRWNFKDWRKRTVAGTVWSWNAKTINWTFDQFWNFVVAFLAAINYFPRAKKIVSESVFWVK